MEVNDFIQNNNEINQNILEDLNLAQIVSNQIIKI